MSTAPAEHPSTRPNWADVRADVDRAIQSVARRLQENPDGELAADLAELVSAAAKYGEMVNRSISAARRARLENAAADQGYETRSVVA